MNKISGELSTVHQTKHNSQEGGEEGYSVEETDILDKERTGGLMEDSRFVFSELTALDKNTKLMWTRDANIAGEGRNWDAAFDFIKQLNNQNYAEYSDWRLPDIKELETLVDYAKSQGMGDEIYELFNSIGFYNVQCLDVYWSSTTNINNTNDAWTVAMWNGRVDCDDKYHRYSLHNIWPVRSGK